MSFTYSFYKRMITSHPRLVLFIMLLPAIFLGFQIKHFALDASSDTLILENDPALQVFRRTVTRYNVKPLTVVTFTPNSGELFDQHNLDLLKNVRDEINAISTIDSVVTILDVPLFQNPPVPITQVVTNLKTISGGNVDLELAEKELSNSPLFVDQLLSSNGKTTTLAIYVAHNKILDDILKKRAAIRTQIDTHKDNAKYYREYHDLTPVLRQLQRDERHRIDTTIAEIRKVIKKYDDNADMICGGTTVITNDTLRYIRTDLVIFGIAIFFCVIFTLKFFFKKKRWVVLPVISCVYSSVVMFGLLGLMKKPITIISSNFISLLLIMTISLVIHLIVQYKEVVRLQPELDQQAVILETVTRKWIPCFFTTLTTIIGFASLILCDIKPVKEFGIMMAVGLTVSMVSSFLIFPALLMLMSKEDSVSDVDSGTPVTRMAANVVRNRPVAIVVLTILTILFIVAGLKQLTVENSFANHFSKSSEVYKSLNFIDKTLAGTTSFDVLITLPEEKKEPVAKKEEDDDFDDFGEFEDESSNKDYWFTPYKLKLIRQTHGLLESYPETGKVESFATLLQLTDQLNENTPLESMELAILMQKLPEYAKDLLFKPYLSIENNEIRFSVRVYDTNPDLKRDAFLKQVKADLLKNLDLPDENIEVNGIMVLYNGVLQSLFKSQILTISTVFAILFVMFAILFRSVTIAFIALFPNLISSLSVLGILGNFGIPLDIMTITIASISISIAVDDTIHYIHRFEEEFKICRNYRQAMEASHKGVGSAMFYTSVTMIAGFSLLVFSNFIPSVLFGVLTSFAMGLAILSALTLLPYMIILMKPFGKADEC